MAIYIQDSTLLSIDMIDGNKKELATGSEGTNWVSVHSVGTYIVAVGMPD